MKGFEVMDPHISARPGVSRQRGLSLFFAMMALVAIALATVALVRSVDTGTLIIGNLGFKQSATIAADRGAEDAIAWLQPRLGDATLHDDIPLNGYYATSMDVMDPTNKGSETTRALVDWNHDGCAYAASGSYTACLAPSAPVTFGDHTITYIITRICKTAGDHNAAGNYCAKPVESSTDSASPKRGELKYGDDKRFQTPPGPFFRVIVRSSGARNTTSYTETVVHF